LASAETARRRGKTIGSATPATTVRLREIERELDQEQALQIGAAGLGFIGVLLAFTVTPACIALTAMAFLVLGQYALLGWSPPMALLAKLGLRRSHDIDCERYALAARTEEPAMPALDRAGAD
jgi:hypothetical protein